MESSKKKLNTNIICPMPCFVLFSGKIIRSNKCSQEMAKELKDPRKMSSFNKKKCLTYKSEKKLFANA